MKKKTIIYASIAVFMAIAAVLGYMLPHSAAKTPKAADLPVLATETETENSTFLEAKIMERKYSEAAVAEIEIEVAAKSAPESAEIPNEQPAPTQNPTAAPATEELMLKKLVSLASDPPPEPETLPPTEPPPPPPPQIHNDGTESATSAPPPPPPPPAHDYETAAPFSDVVPEPYGYFRDILMLGDSMTTGFDMYRSSIKFEGKDVLRDVSVVAVVSYGVNNALREISNRSIHPYFMGKQTRPEDIIATKDSKYVCICLGINDLVWQPVDGFIKSYATLVDRIKEKSPDKTIVVMSLTPIVAGSGEGELTNAKITEANAALSRFAAGNGFPFLDYAAALRDSQNSLPRNFSSDGYCHFTIAAYNKLVEYMLTHPLG
ncbi:MAG: GDSL-type esterase/lipase family protein [Oscillospiraceae bacterium]|nr:GDSL-type esterase/lipase family protein [Oscillospiraceae bacterium]